MLPEKKKSKSISNIGKGNLFNQITISNGEEASQKFNQKKKKSDQICKGKNSTEQMDVDKRTHFQEEILADILNRLPVRSLLRFKCVSKLWETLISEPYFKMTHLNHAKNEQNSQKLLIRCLENDLYSMYCVPLSSSVQPVENVRKLDFSVISRPYNCAIRGCCDGLVVIHVNDNIDGRRTIHLLWNPSTGESILLPNPELPKREESRLGLGYDSTSGGYKILKIHTNIDRPGEILALKSSSWRNIDKHPRGICNEIEAMQSLPIVNEAFHWIGIFGSHSVVSRNYLVVSFSISSEVYGEIPLPEQILCSKAKIIIGVSVLEGMLCVYSNSYLQRKAALKLWVLKDYGVKESWTTLLTIEGPWIDKAMPKYRFADGELLFWCLSHKCTGHAFRTSRGPFRLWPRCDILQTGITFTESLISPKSLI
ncbi:F-box/kelch-repeat protein At3g23880-like isoform X1 [Lycium barbarum]|uniref:F-box/kelch-repeat protein At3g23880-like isoform X1 n=1 Tax=Lycium barbarum TaxID=112863 RepID=UPI00293E2A30|nr:F-box/kelch-repeat protein At3g23880-like isoform X1 [Lycium barbarum]XP_060193501.1 F-box/kelch-repeat protein At3g23880-like isoform X1 [Lycium barbarum]